MGNSFESSSGTRRRQRGGSMTATTLGKGVEARAHGRGREWRSSSVVRGGLNRGGEAPFYRARGGAPRQWNRPSNGGGGECSSMPSVSRGE
jgi:hypothetical protein